MSWMLGGWRIAWCLGGRISGVESWWRASMCDCGWDTELDCFIRGWLRLYADYENRFHVVLGE